MRISAIITRIIQQMKRDRRTLALLFLAPLLVLSLMYFIFNSNEASVTLVVSNAPAPLIDKLKRLILPLSWTMIFQKNSYKIKSIMVG